MKFPEVKDVAGVFAGDVHPEVDDEVEVLKWIWNTDPGKHWVLCVLRKMSLEQGLQNCVCK